MQMNAPKGKALQMPTPVNGSEKIFAWPEYDHDRALSISTDIGIRKL